MPVVPSYGLPPPALAVTDPPPLEWIACPACGADAAEPVAGPVEMAAERAWLEGFHARRTRAGAPPARRKDRLEFTETYRTGVVACRDCGVVHRNPVRPTRAQLEAYRTDEYAPALLEAAWAAGRDRYAGTVALLEARLGRAGSVIEVGSFAGGFLEAARGRGFFAVGVEVGDQVTAFARAKGLRVLSGELPGLPLPRGAFDAALVLNCFDHLRDPSRELSALAACLKPEGVLVVRVPNGDLYRAARRVITAAGRRGTAVSPLLALLACNNLLAFPYLCAYGPAPLSRLLARHGFLVERVVHDTLLPLADRYTPVWAAWEERALKAWARWGTRLLDAATGGRVVLAPWLEVVARRRSAVVASTRARAEDPGRPDHP